MKRKVKRRNAGNTMTIALMGLALSLVVNGLQKHQILDGKSYIIPTLMTLGGLIQLISGIKRLRNFYLVIGAAFTGYGLYWTGIGLSWVIRTGMLNNGKAESTPGAVHIIITSAAFLVFSLLITFMATETNKVLFTTICLLDLYYFISAFTAMTDKKDLINKPLGVLGYTIAALCLYIALANYINTKKKRMVLPVGKPLGIFKKN